jgi:AraC-like DNA-binding protein
MIENLTYITSALLGFVTIFLAGYGYRSSRYTNLYLLAIFFISSMRFLTYSLTNNLEFSEKQKPIDLFIIVSLAPLSYLYFKNLIYNTKTFKKGDFIHFIIPLVYFAINVSVNYFEIILARKIAFIFLVLFNTIYAIACYLVLKKNIWKPNKEILLINQQNKIIKKWTKILFGLFLLILLRFIINLSLNNPLHWYINKNNYSWIGAIIWIIMYLKILSSPEFLYGNEVFENKIKEFKKHNIIFDNIWIHNATIQVVNVQDSILKKKMATNIESYIIEIEHQALNSSLFFSDTFSVVELSNKLNIPKSHVYYLFKYHSKISFSDFKKIIRIQRSILLIDGGYLKSSTFDSLASETGFSSYSSFFKSFKNIIGVAPQEYYLSTNSK